MEETIVELLARVPFVPFTVIMSNGIRYEVNSAESTIADEWRLHIFEAASDRQDVLRLDHVSAVEILKF
jgi:hypothetical protein